MNRREFIAGFFSGVMLLGVGASSIVKVFHVHDHYVALPGKFNVWYIQDEFWHLFCDSHQAPFEFNSYDEAEEFVEKSKFTSYHNCNRKSRKSFDGLVIVREAPTVIHDFSHLRLSEDEANDILIQIKQETAIDDYGETVVKNFLISNNGLEQARIWVDAIGDINHQQSILLLSRNRLVRDEIIRPFYPFYYRDNGSSYHMNLACLETFQPSRLGVKNWSV